MGHTCSFFNALSGICNNTPPHPGLFPQNKLTKICTQSGNNINVTLLNYKWDSGTSFTIQVIANTKLSY
jgi:hypothetical protein